MVDPIKAGARFIDVASKTPSTDRSAVADSDNVQVLRGLACVLLVAFHVIGSRSNSGMVVADDSLWRVFANTFAPLRMPLFAFLSGLVYAYRPVIAGYIGLFVRKKFVRLWLPLLTVSTIYYLATLVTPGTTGRLPLNDMWKIYFFSYVHFWFLQAIIVIFAVTLILEKLGALATVGRYVPVLVVAFVLNPILDPYAVTFMSWRPALYLAPFFLLGIGAHRFRDVIRGEYVLKACSLVFVITLAVHGYQMTSWDGVARTDTIIGMIAGATGALTLLWCLPHIGPLAKLGAYSFTVYMYHPFFVFPARKVFEMLHMTTHEVVFVGCLLAGLIGPAIMEMIVRRIPVARTALLGQR